MTGPVHLLAATIASGSASEPSIYAASRSALFAASLQLMWIILLRWRMVAQAITATCNRCVIVITQVKLRGSIEDLGGAVQIFDAQGVYRVARDA